MNKHQLNRITSWFDGFVAAFTTASPEEQRNYDLKIEHTVRVRAIIERLATSLALAPEDVTLAAAIAICHDVGRFPQYRDYGTFNDATSVNHASLAIRTLKEEGVLDFLDTTRRSILLQAVSLHNAFVLPDHLEPVTRQFSLLIRDADKLDIWKILIDYCTSVPEERASAVTWELPDTGTCSKQALEEVISGRMLNRSLLASADDFKLLQLSWAFDLNFDESFSILTERGYIETLAALLPDEPGCRKAANTVRNFVRSRQEKTTGVD